MTNKQAIDKARAIVCSECRCPDGCGMWHCSEVLDMAEDIMDEAADRDWEAGQ